MAVVVVGGQSRKVGKTSVMAGLIAATQEMHWTAMKITSHAHESAQSVGVFEETDAGNGTDTGRYLAAGAVRSLWVRASELALAMARISGEIAASESVMLESNGVLEFLQPDIFVGVVDAGVDDVKASARRYLKRADVWVVVGDRLPQEMGEPPAALFRMGPEGYCPAGLVEFVRQRIGGEAAKSRAPIARSPAS
jgi:hypothetical protein